MDTMTKTLAGQIKAIENSLGDLWMARFFPGPGATRKWMMRTATNAGRKAYAIMLQAEAEGDKTTAKSARDLAKRLLPIASGEGRDRALFR